MQSAITVVNIKKGNVTLIERINFATHIVKYDKFLCRNITYMYCICIVFTDLGYFYLK